MKSIRKIKIDSYRGIKNLEFDNLSMINIITGDNNSGKTSLLEILSSFSQPDSIIKWSSLIRKEFSRRAGLTYFEGIYDLFDISSDEKKISYTIETEEENVTLEAVANETMVQISDYEYNRHIGYYIKKEDIEELKQSMREVTKLNFKVFLNRKKVLNEYVYEDQKSALIGEYQFEQNPQLRKNIIYISPVHHAMGTIYLSEVLDNPELYEEMLSVLKDYDENIVSINYDKDSKSSAGIYKILSKSHRKALPLNVYGDGMKKAILLMSAVVKAKNGILLLDEFETAIHTSAMKKTFKWIIETCKKLNVQVFMTTHSLEAVDKMIESSGQFSKDIRVIRLKKKNEKTFLNVMDGEEALEARKKYNWELRV